MTRIIGAILAIVLCTAISARAEVTLHRPEVHAVGIYEGQARAGGGTFPRPDVRVVIERPDEEVILMLGSHEPVRWMVEAADGTTVSKIVMHGHGRDSSAVWLNGAPHPDVILSDLAVANQPAGPRFRTLLAQVQGLTGIARLSSFSGAYTADPNGFVIKDEPVYQPSFEADYLRHYLLAEDEVPEAFRPLLLQIGRGERLGRDVQFTEAGFVLSVDGAAPVTYAVTANVPPISHPAGATRNPGNGRLFGVSFGSEGFLYACDIAENEWSVVSSLGGADASGVIYDWESGRVVIVISGLVGWQEPELLFIGWDGAKTKTTMNLDLFAGLADLYDPGGSPAPGFLPVAIEGDRLLLVTTDGFGSDVRRTDQLQPIYRAYIVSMRSGAVGLAGYDGISAVAPEPW